MIIRDRSMDEYPFILVNDARVYLETRRVGAVHIAPDTSSEQCAHCGHDIAESGTVTPLHVVCDCGARYPIVTLNS